MPDLSEQANVLRPGQVQRFLGICASTLWDYVHRGLLTPSHHTAGGHARYLEPEVVAFKAELSARRPERAAA
ncbi:MAG TPA: helix-turn-helix domain-containing protein [Streptosporangiaceae bacterium]|nr:helix-turn-helix domain-containing protein [Streptosporangiaceae bacterium]